MQLTELDECFGMVVFNWAPARHKSVGESMGIPTTIYVDYFTKAFIELVNVNAF